MRITATSTANLNFGSRYDEGDAALRYKLRYRDSYARRITHWRQVQVILSLLGDDLRCGRVLDIPTGAGRLLPALADRGAAVIGCEPSRAMLHEARRATDNGVRLVQAALPQLPFSDGSFTAGICIRLLHHLDRSEERRAVLSELRRVVAGPLVVTFWRHRRNAKVSRRFAISRATFQEEAEAAGWRVARTVNLFPIGSREVLARLEPA